ITVIVVGYRFTPCVKPEEMREILIALASVSAVFWAGGIIFRQLSPILSDELRGAFQFLGFGTFAPLVGVITSGPILKVTIALFLIYYIPGILLWGRQLSEISSGDFRYPEWSKTPDQQREYAISVLKFGLLYFVTITAIVALLIWTDFRLLAWMVFVLDFVAYQIFLSKLLFLDKDEHLGATIPQLLLRSSVAMENLTVTLQKIVQQQPPTTS